MLLLTFLRLDHGRPHRVLRAFLFQVAVLPGAGRSPQRVLEGVGWSLAVNISMGKMWGDAWRQVHGRSREAHVRRDGEARPHRSTDTCEIINDRK